MNKPDYSDWKINDTLRIVDLSQPYYNNRIGTLAGMSWDLEDDEDIAFIKIPGMAPHRRDDNGENGYKFPVRILVNLSSEKRKKIEAILK